MLSVLLYCMDLANLLLAWYSSCCLQHSSYWPALLVAIAITIAAILAGIALVTLLLVLNMAVAIGALNGLIFYANVVFTNRSILFPFQETNFIMHCIHFVAAPATFLECTLTLKVGFSCLCYFLCSLHYHHQLLLYQNFKSHWKEESSGNSGCTDFIIVCQAC